MEEAGYRPPKTERKDHMGVYEALRPSQLWHLDFVHRHIHQQKVCMTSPRPRCRLWLK